VHVIGNEGNKGFEDKMERTVEAIKSVLANPPLSNEKLRIAKEESSTESTTSESPLPFPLSL